LFNDADFFKEQFLEVTLYIQHMIKVGITGQPGFMGSHLFNFLGTKQGIERIPFKDEFFDDPKLLNDFVNKCNVIVHLAAMNRHKDPQVIYDTNIALVKKLITACGETNSRPHIIFSSSTQEERDNLYGKSKLDGRKLLEDFTAKNNSGFTGMVIPNVFGPFGRPYYNSVVATFCHQLSHGEIPEIHVDGNLKLIYINELVEEFYQQILKSGMGGIVRYPVPHTSERKVSEILAILTNFKEDYLEKGIIPNLDDPFKLSLFNTYRCYIDYDHYPFKYVKHTDDRGSFVEIMRANTSGQFSYSTTKPGITRGNHYHTRKAERFAVISGKARIQLRKIGTSDIIEYILDGENPSFVDMPIWFTHNITNIGKDELITLFWINEPYNQEDPDTFFENV